MTETPQGRNRRADRHPRVEEAAPKAASRSRQPRAPIGRSQELMERQATMQRESQPSQRMKLTEPVRNARRTSAYDDFAPEDFSARAAKPIRKKKKDRHTFLWLMVALQVAVLIAKVCMGGAAYCLLDGLALAAGLGTAAVMLT